VQAFSSRFFRKRRQAIFLSLDVSIVTLPFPSQATSLIAMPSDNPTESMDLLALALVPGLGPRLTEALIKRFGSAGGIRRASAADLASVPHIGDKLSSHFAAALQSIQLDQELKLLQRHDVRLVPRSSDEYPAPLKEIADPPHLLFVRGEWRGCDAQSIGIVGSRQYTSYGRRIAEQLASGLSRAGFTIVSGLARGIDGFAHQAALDADGRTIAVLAGGLSRIYPPEHADLAEKIVDHGALITETPMMVQPQPGMFPARNRLISGLCRAVIVVEAHERSGALITARHALEQNREVFAVPGAVDNIASAGCMKLLRQGAKLIRGVEDVLEDLKGIAAPARPQFAKPTATQAPELSGDLKRIWESIGDGRRFVDQLVQELKLGVPEVIKGLTQLEMKRLVRKLPGNQYERR